MITQPAVEYKIFYTVILQSRHYKIGIFLEIGIRYVLKTWGYVGQKNSFKVMKNGWFSFLND